MRRLIGAIAAVGLIGCGGVAECEVPGVGVFEADFASVDCSFVQQQALLSKNTLLDRNLISSDFSQAFQWTRFEIHSTSEWSALGIDRVDGEYTAVVNRIQVGWQMDSLLHEMIHRAHEADGRPEMDNTHSTWTQEERQADEDFARQANDNFMTWLNAE